MNRIPPSLQEMEGSDKSELSAWERDELAYKNMWNFNLPDAAYGSLLFNVHNGIMASEMRSYGLNFSYRRNQQTPSPAASSVHSSAPVTNNTAEKPNQYRNSTSDWQQEVDNNNYNNNRNSKRQSMVKYLRKR